MRRTGMFIILVAFLALVTGFGSVTTDSAYAADEVIKWKCVAHWPMASSSYKGSLLAVAERLKERTNGRLILEPHPAGALVPAKEEFNAVKRGMVPIGVTSAAYPLSQVPLMNVASGLPLNFGDVWEAAYFYKWLGFEQMLKDEVAKHGLLYFTDKVYPTELSLK